MQPQKHHVIIGTGPLGLWVAEKSIQQGHQVTLVNRSGRLADPLAASVPVVACDATQPDEVAQVCRDADAVFHCAMPPYTQWPEAFPSLTQGILEGVARTSARLIYGDNLYMYGDTHGQPLTEDLPPKATTRKGRVRADMAEMILEAHRRGDVPVAIGRGSDFYGPRVIHALFGQMFFEAAFAGKTANLLGDLQQPHTFTYIEDFASALITLSEHEEALGQVWHVPNPPTLTTQDMVTIFEEALGRPIKARGTGKVIMAILGLFNPFIKETREMMYQWEQPFVVDHSRFERAFGAQVTPHKTAAARTVAWYRGRLGID